MAAATVALTVVDTWVDKSRLHVKGTLDFDTGDYAAGGVTLSFAKPTIRSTRIPDLVIITARAAAGAAIALYTYVPGASRDVGKVVISDLATNAELATGAIPAAIGAAVLDIYAVFKKFI